MPGSRGRDVAIVGMHYAPEPSGNAPYTTSLAEGLVQRGHRVHVVTGTPHYPDWQVHDGYGQWRRTTDEAGVRVTRLRHYVARRPNSARRLAMETTYGVRAALQHVRSADVVVCVSPALFGSAVVSGSLHLGHRRPPMGLWVQDLYGLGVGETGGSGRLASALGRLEGRVVRSFDGVAVAHERFRAHLVTSTGLDPDTVRVIRNWTHQRPSSTDVRAARVRLGWGESEVVCLHAGNMGAKQGLENVVDAARLAQSQAPELRFVLLGGGNQESLLRERAQGLDNVEFLGSMSEEAFTEALGAADILVVNERPGVKEMSIPSKLTSYFTSGRPVLAAVDPDSVTAAEVRRSGAGACVVSGDPAAFVAQASRLAADHDAAHAMGLRGQDYAGAHLSGTAALDAFESWLEELVTRRGTG